MMLTTQPANPRSSTAISTALAALVACAVLLPLLGHKPLAEWDEGIYAEVSREMLGGSWLTPHWNAQLWLEKPPLMLWVTAVFFKLFGVTEFWARAGSAFSGIAIVALLHSWLARTRDLLTAGLSTIILLATLGFLHVCHVGEMDVLLSLGACLALIGLSQVQANDRNGWYVFWIGFAIALMTKGAASVTIPITAVLFAVVQRWKLKQFGRAFAFGLAIFLALVLPWHLAMYHRFSHEFLAQYLGLHVLARATQQIEGHRTHWWYYIVVLIASAPPFVLLYPVAIYRGFRRAALQPWAIFAVVTVVFFTLIQTRLPHYIAPAYPALAVLTAVWVADWLKSRGLSVGAWGLSPTNTESWKRGALAPGLLRTGLITAAVWVISILATHSTLKSLHSADLAGPGLLDNREADALLKSAPLPAMPGPLLYLRNGRVQSIATVVFYARVPVQQVILASSAPETRLDRYMFDPVPLSEAVGSEPRLILLDKDLIPLIPREFAYTPLDPATDVELGTIARRLVLSESSK
jgi:4-amino-4-deoxy-L-arabinose transferase-like glycosyltransferase